MRPRTEISAAQVGAIHRAMLAAPNKSAFQRLQCLWLRASQELSTEAIAQAVGLSVSQCGASGPNTCAEDWRPVRVVPKADAVIKT